MITFNLKHLIFTVSFLLYSCSNNKELEEHRHKKLSDKIYEINIELSKQRTQIEELKAQLISFKDSLNKFDTKNDLDKLFLNVRNSVYLIRTTNNNNEVSLGSAFCISKDGIAISNHHVFENAAKSFAYNNNGSEFLITEIIEENKTFDYIIFRMGPLSKPLEFLPISYEYTKIGENVFTIGNPKGLEQTLSNGIVSGYRNNNLIQNDN